VGSQVVAREKSDGYYSIAGLTVRGEGEREDRGVSPGRVGLERSSRERESWAGLLANKMMARSMFGLRLFCIGRDSQLNKSHSHFNSTRTRSNTELRSRS